MTSIKATSLDSIHRRNKEKFEACQPGGKGTKEEGKYPKSKSYLLVKRLAEKKNSGKRWRLATNSLWIKPSMVPQKEKNENFVLL